MKFRSVFEDIGVWIEVCGMGTDEKNISVDELNLNFWVVDGKNKSTIFIWFCIWTAKALICWRSWKTGTNGIASAESFDIEKKSKKLTIEDFTYKNM